MTTNAFDFNIQFQGPSDSAASYVAGIATRVFGKSPKIWSLKVDPKFITISFARKKSRDAFIKRWRAAPKQVKA